jgi:glycosyltransferase involved in cell wall biosynthesis
VNIGYLYNLHAYPPRGGNHVHVLELVQGFLKAGHEVSVLDDPTMPGATNFNGSDRADIQSFVEAIDVLYVRIDARFLGTWPQLRAAMDMAGEKPVVWEINAPANEALAYSWLGGKKAVERESVFRRTKRSIHAARQKPRIRREERYRQNLAERVDAAICVSTALQRYASESLNIQETLVLPNGGPLLSKREIQFRKAKRTHFAFTVLYSGSAIYPWQGLDLLSRTIFLALDKAPDIRFVLAVNQRTALLPGGPNVEIRENLNREEILDAICAADACVALHPDYFWSPWRFHGSPMKMFEYMACMAPVVTSNHGQMAELIHSGVNGVLCGNHPEDILDSLIFLRDHPCTSNRIGQAGWEMIQKDRSWHGNVRETLRLFDTLVGAEKIGRNNIYHGVSKKEGSIP